MNEKEANCYTFRSFRLDIDERQLLNNGVAVPLTPKAFEVIALLVSKAGHLVEKEELMQTVWPDAFVDESNVTRIVHTLRKILGDDQNGYRFIETVAKKGYRFVAEVDAVPDPEIRSQTAPASSERTAPVPNRTTRLVLITAGILIAGFLGAFLFFTFRPDVASKQGVPVANRHPTNDEAYRSYLLGVALSDRWNREDNRKSIESFERAVELDPDYAPAYAGLANGYSVRTMVGGLNSTEEYLKARAAVEKALALDPLLAEAHSYLGEIKLNFEWDFPGAEREHRRAIELNPNSTITHRMYALLLSYLGRPDEAIAEIKTAIDLDPASQLNHKIFGSTLYFARRWDEAIAENKRTIEMGADIPSIYDSLVSLYRLKGDDQQAFEWFVRVRERNGDAPEDIQLWKTIYGGSGWRGVYERQLEEAREGEKKGRIQYMLMTRLYIKLDQHEQALAYLEKAFRERRMAMISLKVNPDLDPLRSDVRFQDLMKRAKFE